MLLRTRLTLILTVVFLIVFGGLWAAANYRASLEQARLADLAVFTQESLWDDVLQERLVRIAAAMRPVARRLRRGEVSMDGPLLPASLEEARAKAPAIDEFQLQDPTGRIIYATTPVVDADPILDRRGLAAMRESPSPLGGLRQDRVDRFVLAMTLPIERDGTLVGFLTAAEDAQAALGQLSAQLGVSAYLVSFRGRLVEGTDRRLWEATSPEIDARAPGMSVVGNAGRLYLTTTIPITDATGGTVGGLVTMRDSTDELVAIERLEQGSFFALGLFVLAVIVAFYLYLQSAFRPIENSIRVLDALSAGDVEATVEEGGEGEARRITDAVSVFRQNVLELRDQRAQADRRRNRQERLIRRELERLAATLDSDGRAEIMDDLAGVLDAQARETPGGDPETSAVTGRIAPDTQLVTLARVLERLSHRITDQHHRLTALVEELREALVTKTRLAMLEQELEIAKDLQYSLLPHPLEADPSFDLDGIMHTAKEVGGDFYDFFRFDETRLAVVVGDVSGKGVPAALFMAITRTQLRSAALDTTSPAAVLARTNTVLATDNDQMMFVTLFYGVLDLATGVLTYANAGHNPPFVQRADGGVEQLPGLGDPAAAVIEDVAYGEETIRLHPGDGLFLYTDGVTEAFDVEGAAFREDRLVEVLRAAGPSASAKAIDEAVLAAVKRFERGADQADDITCLALRWHGAVGAAGASAGGRDAAVAEGDRRLATG